MLDKFPNDWENLLKGEREKEYFKNLQTFLKSEYSSKKIFPEEKDVFRALSLTSYENTKVLILGQDPYHTENTAEGLSFSVKRGRKITPSLRNIYKELEDDLNIKRDDTSLLGWAKQGVLLINAILSVRENSPLSHKNKGWEVFTDRILALLNEKASPVAFVFWGNEAKKKAELITNRNHLILISAHPSPLSAKRGFFGSKPFSKVNNFLEANNLSLINWEE